MRERPLWAIATDSLANQLLTLGRALGDVPAATALAGPLAAAIGAPLPVAALRGRRRAPGSPGGRRAAWSIELPGGRAVHVLPAPAARRAARAAGAGRRAGSESGQEEHRVAELVPAGSARRRPRSYAAATRSGPATASSSCRWLASRLVQPGDQAGHRARRPVRAEHEVGPAARRRG